MELTALRERAKDLGKLVTASGATCVTLMNTDGQFYSKVFKGPFEGQTNVFNWKLVKQLFSRFGTCAVTRENKVISTNGTDLGICEHTVDIDYVVTGHIDRIVGLTTDHKAFVFYVKDYSAEDSIKLKEELESWGELKFLKALYHGYIFVGITKDDKIRVFDIRSYAEEQANAQRIQKTVQNWKDICDVDYVEIKYNQYDLIGIKNNGEVVTTFNPNGARLEFLNFENVVQIESFCGSRAGAYFLLSDGRLYFLKGKELFLESEDVIAVKAEDTVALYIKKDGTVYSSFDGAGEYSNFPLFRSLDNYKEELSDMVERTIAYIDELNREIKALEDTLPSLNGIFKKKQKEETMAKIYQLERATALDMPTYSHTTITTEQIYEMKNAIYAGAGSTGKGTKDASVIGRAVAGGVIAGPVGAVVGAISAVDANNRKKK